VDATTVDPYHQLMLASMDARPPVGVPWEGAVVTEQMDELAARTTVDVLDQARGFDGATTDDSDYGQAQAHRERRLDLEGVTAPGDVAQLEAPAYLPEPMSHAGWDGETDAFAPFAE
jgi:hypothetical protein